MSIVSSNSRSEALITPQGKVQVNFKSIQKIVSGKGNNGNKNNKNKKTASVSTSPTVYTIPNYGGGFFTANGLGIPYIFNATDTTNTSHTITQLIPSTLIANSYYFSDAANNFFKFTFDNSLLPIEVMITGGGVPYTLLLNNASGLAYSLFTFISTSTGLQETPPMISVNGSSPTPLPNNT